MPNAQNAPERKENPMLDELKAGTKIVGLKQSLKALREEKAVKIFLAEDAEEGLKNSVLELAGQKNVPVVYVATRFELGQACDIRVGCAVCTLL